VLFIGALPFTVNLVLSRTSFGSTAMQENLSPVRDAPPDTTSYTRKAVAEDLAPGGRVALPNVVTPQAVVVDTVVSNTDSSLTNTDTFNDGEPTIAINPANANEIVISAFSGGWGANAPIWHSTDGGDTWTKRFTVPVPPNQPSAKNCPCDQAFDYGRGNQLAGTFLSFQPTDVYSGITTNPASSAAWNWLLNMGTAQRTNSVGVGNTDQPWLLVNRDNATASQDNVYVAYDDFTTNPVTMRVAASLGVNPPNFTRDNSPGVSGGGINPGHRMAVDPRNGWIYSLFQQSPSNGTGGQNINYRLNRSTDGGQTWTLNGSGTGVTVASAVSTQAFFNATFMGNNCTANPSKFGTVNALLGGADHATVDPNNGDVYYVYGNRDGGTGNNRLAIRRLTDNGMGGLTIGAEVFVTGQVQTALPSVAVTANGTIGVLYTQYDGMSGGFPSFSVHFAISTDQGATFPTNITLENFLSSATDNGNCRQRVLGDYQQVKAMGNTFFGVFTGNGAPFGRPFANHDAIFFRVPLACEITCPANITQSNDANQCGAVVTYPAPTTVSCGNVNCTPVSGSFFPVGTTQVTCSTEAGPSCNFNVTINDTQLPTITCPNNIIAVTNNPGDTCVNVNFTVTATDNCPNFTVVCGNDANLAQIITTGFCFSTAVGCTTVRCTVTDASGNTATCKFTVCVYDGRVQDDSNPANELLFNSFTGNYVFCCNGTTICGTGSVTRKGQIFTLLHNPADRRVLADVDGSTFKGKASLQMPPGSLKCTLTDRDIRNDTLTCGGACVFP
jgi:hypothetical protein